MRKIIFLSALVLSFSSMNAQAEDVLSAKKEVPKEASKKAKKGAAKEESLKMSSPTPEMREEMAKSHEKMALCLRSDKPMKDCHKEMHKGSQHSAGKSCEHEGKSCKHEGKTCEHEDAKHSHEESHDSEE